WFATTASLPAIRAHYPLTPFHAALLTSSVQAGFVAGTLVSALLSLADRFDLRRLFAAGAAVAGIANVAILFLAPTSAVVPVLRFLTGACMAAVYPVGMKLAATWAA
ncbi:MFS transporter, partial [Acidisphaera rubrifaciens]|uniref:MFS transporter n=1 Tax=Acidisphaera rubrifaciens TaxID=50715 RepID=UPI000662403D